MTRGWELPHVGADLGDKDLSRGLAQTRNLLQSFKGVTKGLQRGLDPRIEGCDRLFQLFNGLYMLADEEAMMRANASVQRICKLCVRWGDFRRRDGSREIIRAR